MIPLRRRFDNEASPILPTMKPLQPPIRLVSPAKFAALVFAACVISWLVTYAVILASFAAKRIWCSDTVALGALLACGGPVAYVLLHLHQTVHEFGHVLGGRVFSVSPQSVMLGKGWHLKLPFGIFNAPIFVGIRWGGFANFAPQLYGTDCLRRRIMAASGPMAGSLFALAIMAAGMLITPVHYDGFALHLDASTIGAGGALLFGEALNLSGILPGSDGRFVWNFGL